MQTTQGHMLVALQAVKTFLDDNAALLPDVVKSGAHADLLDVIASLESHVDGQAKSNGAAKSASQLQHSLRKALTQDHMVVIARIARASLPNTPEVQPLKMPRGEPSITKLASHAFEMASTAEAHAAVFVTAGLPADFVADLRKATRAMLDAGEARHVSRAKRGGATSGLKFKISAARKTVSILDAMVKTALRNDPPLIANWKLAKRSVGVSGRSGTAAPVPAPTQPSTPATHGSSTAPATPTTVAGALAPAVTG